MLLGTVPDFILLNSGPLSLLPAPSTDNGVAAHHTPHPLYEAQNINFIKWWGTLGCGDGMQDDICGQIDTSPDRSHPVGVI